MKKLSLTLILTLLFNVTNLLAVFEATKSKIILKVTDSSINPDINFIPKMGIDLAECEPLMLEQLYYALREAGYYPMELDIINTSTTAYRLGLSSIQGRCKVDYAKINSIIVELSKGHNRKIVAGILLNLYGFFLNMYGVALFSGERIRMQNKLNEVVFFCCGTGSGIQITGIGLLLWALKNAKEAGREFAKRYVQPEDIIIKPGERIKKFIFLTPQGFNNSNFIVSLVNNEQSDDIVSFNVAIR